MPALSRGTYGQKPRARLRASVFLALAGMLVGLGLAKLSGPLGTLREQEERLAQLSLARDGLIAERDRLQRRTHHLATSAGQEVAARRRGYLRPGERRLVFVRADATEDSGADDAPETSQ